MALGEAASETESSSSHDDADPDQDAESNFVVAERSRTQRPPPKRDKA